MYQPPHFIEDRMDVMHALIREHPLGLLAVNGPQGPVANPVPFLLFENSNKGVLRCHVARANPVWQMMQDAPDMPVLVVFQGPQAYVTPSWYASKAEHGKVVPTWNYVVVQARGRAVVHPESEWILSQVSRLTDTHEANRGGPWKVGDAPENFVDMQLRAIVGVEIVIDDLAGKWKVSQNRPASDRAGVISGYSDSNDPGQQKLSELLADRH